jgi:mono/diheme cytochrome c family protein
VLTAAGKLPVTPAAFVDQGAAHQPAITAEPTPAYGAYLAASCTGCHTERFAGGPMPGAPPGAPPAANITPDSVSGIGRWSEAEFMHALRTGQRPDGTAIDSTRMPIPMTRQMSDVELRAIYRYLRTVPPRTVAPRAVAAR